MEIKEQISLRFKGIDFPSVQLNSIKPYIEGGENKISVEIQPKAFIPSDNTNTFKIIMTVDISAEDCFNLKVTGVGNFEISKEDISPETRRSFINANSTAIVFPYIRAFISSLTCNLGNVTTPIILPTRFFKGDYIEEANTEQ